MATTAIHCGKRSSGKTVAGVRRTLEFLKEWDVVVFSNVHLKPEECALWLGPEVNVLGRLVAG